MADVNGNQAGGVVRFKVIVGNDVYAVVIMNNNEAAATMMAAYIVACKPGVIGVDVDTTGEMQSTELLYA